MNSFQTVTEMGREWAVLLATCIVDEHVDYKWSRRSRRKWILMLSRSRASDSAGLHRRLMTSEERGAEPEAERCFLAENTEVLAVADFGRDVEVEVARVGHEHDAGEVAQEVRIRIGRRAHQVLSE